MHIEERKVTVREVTEGYFNDAEEGVVGYDDQLDIRPKYQREFVYKDKQRAVRGRSGRAEVRGAGRSAAHHLAV